LGNTDCAAGLTCLSGVCHAFCATLDTACPGGECVQAGDGQPQDLVCLVSCTPAPVSCGAGQACEVFTLNGSLTTDCEGPGTVAAGGSCTMDSDCAAGLGCIGTPAACLQWCQLSPNATSCASGNACTGFDTPFIINGITYGACPE
jgi:hypothetical protein